MVRPASICTFSNNYSVPVYSYPILNNHKLTCLKKEMKILFKDFLFSWYLRVRIIFKRWRALSYFFRICSDQQKLDWRISRRWQWLCSQSVYIIYCMTRRNIHVHVRVWFIWTSKVYINSFIKVNVFKGWSSYKSLFIEFALKFQEQFSLTLISFSIIEFVFSSEQDFLYREFFFHVKSERKYNYR